MSLDEAVMDLSNVFEFGQGYVALSRVRRLSGLHLLGYNEQTFQIHPNILARDAEFKEESKQASKSKIDETLQNKFVFNCGGTIETASKKELKEIAKKKSTINKIPTKIKTYDIWKQGKSVPEVAEERKLKITTIMGHIEELFMEDKISRDEIFTRMVSPELKKALPEIHKTFTDLDTELLTPIKIKLKDKYDFKDLRIARLLRD